MWEFFFVKLEDFFIPEINFMLKSLCSPHDYQTFLTAVVKPEAFFPSVVYLFCFQKNLGSQQVKTSKNG